MESNHEPFLREIVEYPDDDTPRLIYADWLEEQGDPRSEFIRLQCHLETIDETDPNYEELRLRAEYLLREVGSGWPRPTESQVKYCNFRRGFPEEVSMSLSQLNKYGQLLFGEYPISSLITSTKFTELENQSPLSGSCLEKLKALTIIVNSGEVGQRETIQSPHLHGLEKITLGGVPLNSTALPLLLSGQYLPELRAFGSDFRHLHWREIAQFFESSVARQLRELTIFDWPRLSRADQFPGLNRLQHLRKLVCPMGVYRTRDGMFELPVNLLEACPQIDTLEFHYVRARNSPENGEVLFSPKFHSLFSQLKMLALDMAILSQVKEEDWLDLPAPNLRLLRISRNEINRQTSWLNTPFLEGLYELKLWKCEVRHMNHLLESRTLPTLRVLELSSCNLDSLDINALGHCSALSELLTLDLSGNQLSSHGAKQFAQANSLKNLRSLKLNGMEIGAAGVKAILESTTFDELQFLSVKNVGPLSRDLCDALRERFGNCVDGLPD